MPSLSIRPSTFLGARHSLRVLFLSQAIACLKHESDIIARRAILPRSYGAVRKGTPAIDDRETDEVNTHDRAGMLIG